MGWFVGICNTAVPRCGRVLFARSDWRFACSAAVLGFESMLRYTRHTVSLRLVSVHQVCGRSSLVSATLNGIQLHLGGTSSMHGRRRRWESTAEQEKANSWPPPSHPMVTSQFNSLHLYRG